MRFLFTLIAFIALASCQPVPTVQAEPAIPPCLPVPKMKAQVNKLFGEEPLIKGVAKDGSYMTIYASGIGWTMTRTVNKKECLWIVGEGRLTIIGYNDGSKESADALP
mgnify:CR=1 FL=1|tara:strand:+ start:486 stop:809 length:324 start_codon:yes stop_codon:yes gene_type:complete